MSEHELETTLLDTVRRYGLFAPGDAVVAALSGGADSTALCCLLSGLRERLGLSGLAACHLNHGIRGEEAEEDMALARALCLRLDIPFYSEYADVPALAAAQGRSLEDAGRVARYAFFARTADAFALRLGLPAERVRVATAHTLSDNAETVLLNLVRGSALSGLCGIPPVRGRFVRPLLRCSRGQIEAYLDAREIPYARDSTNLSDAYRRNRLRHTVLPLLERENPRFCENVASMTEILRGDDAFLSQCTDQLLEDASRPNGSLDRTLLSDAPPALRNRAAARLLKLSGARVDSRKTLALAEALRKGDGGVSIAPGQGWRVTPRRVYREAASVPPKSVEFSSETPFPFGKWVVQGVEQDGKCKLSKKFHENGLKNALDCDKITGKLILRSRQPGDAILLAGRGCEKRLKKLFSEAGLTDRSGIPVLADDLGPVWVGGFGVAQRVFPSPDARIILYIQQTINKE